MLLFYGSIDSIVLTFSTTGSVGWKRIKREEREREREGR